LCVDHKKRNEAVKKNAKVLMIADITGAGVDYHVGDEAMAEVAINRLSNLFGKRNLTMICASPKAIPATYGIKAVTYHSITNDKRASLLFKRPHSYLKNYLSLFYLLLTHKIVFICGGGNITTQWKEVLESRIHLIKWAKRFGKKVILVSQTLGPFNDAHRILVDKYIPLADWIGVRDYHYSHTQTKATVHYAVDDAVFLKPSEKSGIKVLNDLPENKLALSIRKLGTTTNNDLNSLCKLIAAIASEDNSHTVLIPHHAPNGKGDIQLANENKQYWSDDALTIIDPILLASDLKAITGDCKYTISMRYHQLIFALSMGVPAIGIYSNQYTKAKLEGAFKQFGLTPRVISVDDIADHLKEMIKQLSQDSQEFIQAAKHTASTSLEASMKPYLLAKSFQEI